MILKLTLYTSPWLKKNLKFDCLDWLKMILKLTLNTSPWLKKILKFDCLDRLNDNMPTERRTCTPFREVK